MPGFVYLKKRGRFSSRRAYYKYEHPNNPEHTAGNIDNCNQTIESIFQDFESLITAKEKLTTAIQELKKALDSFPQEQVVRDKDDPLKQKNPQTAEWIASITYDMLFGLTSIIKSPQPEDIKKRTELLCDCYEKEVWKVLQPHYSLHPVVKAVGIAVTALAFAVIGFAAAAAMTFIPGNIGTMMSSHVLATIPSSVSMNFLDPTIGKVVVSCVFAAVGAGLGLPLTDFFAKRRVPGNAMKRVEEVAEATKELAKKMQNTTVKDDDVKLRPQSGKGPIYQGY